MSDYDDGYGDGRDSLYDRIEALEAELSQCLDCCKRVGELEAERDRLQSRWDYIKTDITGARALLLLLREGKGTSDEFDTMVDRIIESRKAAGLAGGKR